MLTGPVRAAGGARRMAGVRNTFTPRGFGHDPPRTILHTYPRGNVHVSQFHIEGFVRVPFSQLFETCPDGSVVAKVPLRIGSVDIPPGFALRPRVSLAGIELDSAKVRELEIQPEGQAYRLLDSHC